MACMSDTATLIEQTEIARTALTSIDTALAALPFDCAEWSGAAAQNHDAIMISAPDQILGLRVRLWGLIDSLELGTTGCLV